MTVIACDLIKDRAGEQNSRFETSYTQVWRVQTNDPLDGPQVVVNYSGLPDLFSSYASGNDSDPYALLVRKTPREEGDSHKSWIVTCEYETAAQQDQQTNPLLDPVRYSAGFDQFTTIARQTQPKGLRLVNSVGEQFVPPPEVDQSRPVYVVRRNESFINLPFTIDMVDSVNQAAWKGCSPRTVKCKSITTGEIQNRNGLSFYEVTYEFHIWDLTWDLRILNQGTRFWPGVPFAAEVRQQLPPGSEPITLYVKNDGIVPRGATVSADAFEVTENFSTEKSSAAANVVYLRYPYYKQRNFNAFGF